MAQSAKGRIVQAMLDKHPELPSLTLAKMIFKDHAMDFKNAEDARSMIRAYRGARGEKNRKLNLGGRKHYREDKPINFAPYAMPEPETVDCEPYKLPIAHNNILVIADIHLPNHRKEPIQTACTYALDNKINTVIINGDLLDNTPFTRHEGKRPAAEDVRKWFEQTELFLEWLRDTFPNAAIYWLEGNHDFWYKRWMQAHAWQLDDDPYFTLQERLHIDEYKIKFIPQQQYVMAGKLAICHGHMLMGKWGSGVAPARTVYNKSKKSVLVSHVHTTNEYTETDLEGEITTCWSTGCLCTLTPDYQPMGGRANHGFAHVVFDKHGNFNVKNFRYHKGKIL